MKRICCIVNIKAVTVTWWLDNQKNCTPTFPNVGGTNFFFARFARESHLVPSTFKTVAPPLTGNRSEEVIKWYCLFMILYNDDADLDVSDTCVHNTLLSWVASQYQKGKTSLHLYEARDDDVLGCSSISWTICKQSTPRSRQITTPTRRRLILVSCCEWLF